MTQGYQRTLQCYRRQGYQKGSTIVSPRQDQKGSTSVGQSKHKKTCAMVAKSHKDGKEAFTCVNMERPRSSGNSKKTSLNGLASDGGAVCQCLPGFPILHRTLQGDACQLPCILCDNW